MQKKSVLGMDPLGWLKGKSKKEKPTGDISDQEEQIDNSSGNNNDNELKPAVRDEEEVYDPGDEAEAYNIEEEKVYGSSNETEAHSIEEQKVYEPSDVTEAYRKSILGEKAYAYNVNPRETAQKESPATAFVIVYTILLLILGFIVYRDLTKQIDKLDTKLANIEKQVDAGYINYEDTKDVW